MKRREFITLLGGVAAVPAMLGPRTAHAQHPAMPVIGFLRSASLANATDLVTGFRQYRRGRSRCEMPDKGSGGVGLRRGGTDAGRPAHACPPTIALHEKRI
jgi:hypothetical protein